MKPGSIVSCRKRDWVLLPHENDRVYALRPLVGLDEEEVLVHKELANLVGYVLPMERVTPAEFPWPGAQAVRDAASARLLVEAARLTLREGAAPLRALGRISIRPRPYQLVPLLMALRLDPVRLFIADDVGVGKTIEALLIARELLERGEIQRFAVLCPPALCDQWAREIQDKFNLEPVIIRTGTLSQLETLKPPEYQSVYEYFPVQVISIDFVKTERNRHQFLIFAPELIIVDEAHGCARIGPKHQQQRYELLYDLVKNPQRQPHMIFLTATPHSGIEEAFRSLLGLLRLELETWDLDNLTAAQRAELARHFVQRTRRDIQDSWEEATDFRFPERVTEDVAYALSELYHKLFEAAYGFCAGIVRESKGLGKREQRVRYWGALSLLRCVMSSPAAAIAALQRQVVDEPGSNGAAGIAALDEAADEYESIWARHVFEPTEEQADDETPVPPIEEAARQLPTAQRNILHQLLTLSQEIIETGQDTKLQKATQLAKRLLSEGFHPIFWCRYVATAEYLAKHLRAQLGPEVEVVPITGRMSDEERRIRITEIDPEKPRILVSTDCLSEGVNLQDKFTAVVHYDLPWNPNRLEQREGRVDRFGQPAPRVKAIRFYGQDNPIDGIVIKVLLEKARTIHKTLGIYVPVPEESESVTQAVLEALFLKGRWGGKQLELGFDVERIDRVRELHQTWEEKSTAEKRRRTLFAQGALRPEEVYQEIKAVDAVLGDPEAVRLFVLNATQRIGLPIRPDKRRKGVYRVSLDPAVRETLPPAVEAALPRRRGAQEWLIAFQSPTPEGADYVGRNHPFVATLARYLFEQALLNPNTELVARVGALRTRQVPTLTTILLLRVRYLLTQKNITPRLAEEIILLGYREEAGGSIQPLSRYEASQLFAEAQPDDNMPLTERQELIERALSQVKPWTEQAFEGGTLSPVGEAVRAQINERAAELTDAHRRLRQAMREAQRDLRLVPVFPPDLLGIVVLQPPPLAMKAFPAIQIAGGLLGPELLEEVWKGEAEGQKPEDFGLRSSRRLLDEMSEAFTAAREWWGIFARSLEKEQDVSPARTAQEWLIPLLSRLGYEVQKYPASYELSGLRLEVSYWAGQPEEAPPIVLFGPAQSLDRLPPKGAIRLTPHTLLQEFLNRSEHLWGLVTNGRQLRLLRNSSYLRRQVYIEFDLEKTFAEGLFEDFQVLYRLVHRTRLPSSTTEPEKCYLERYYRLSIEQGGRVREKLREGVERAIILLAEGLLNHPANDALRTRLQSTLTPQDLYHELLRLVYRILFLLVAEARGLIGGEEAPLYLPYYSVSRLRRLIDKQDAYTEHDDLWCGLLVLWKVLADQDLASCLGLTALNGDLFKPILLDSCFVANRDLLRAFWHFLYYQDEAAKGLRRVNYLRLDVEELGSVYESLLDNTPEVGKAERRWTFGFRRGMDRKKTGSYYTPDELVTLVLREALDPVVEERLRQASPNPEAQERAILSLRILDPAAGSGHFLLGAARRLARRLAQIRTGVPDPPAEEYRRAIRDVVQHTLYAVDVNPLAVELCRVALWMESHVPGPPLTFLEHRIKLGNSLVGTLRPDVLAQGIPDEAYQPKATDNRETARLAKKTNQHARQGIQDIFNQLPQPQSALATQLEALTALPENTPEDIAQKAERYRAFQNAVHRLRLAADLWTAAFFQPLQPKKPLLTTHHLRMLLHGGSLPPDVEAMVLTLSAKHHFFHWWLEFPDVMRHGGFDVVLGNPPWERIKLEDKQFFADKAPAIAQAENAAKRKRMITALEKENPALFQAYEEALADAEAVSAFLRHSGRFPLTARGDINTYPLFAELGRSLLRPTGRLGLILPTGIATDDSNKHFFATVVDKRQLAALLDFENREGLFPAIDSRMKFSVFILRGRGAPDPAKLLFFATRAEQAEDPNRPFALSAEDFARLNPNTRTCPVFRTRHDADLTRAIYQHIPILWRENPEENPWRIRFAALFHMANDSHLFRTGAELEAQGFTRVANRYARGGTAYLPLYEGKLLWHYDHRYATFAGGDSREVTPAEHARPDFLIRPRYWVPATEVEKRLADQTWERRWLVGFRDITNTTNERTIVAGLIPYAGAGNTAPLLLARGAGPQILALTANLTSLVLDYVARQKVGGTHLTFYYIKQFPVLPPDRYTAADLHFIVPRVLELVYTAWDTVPLAQDVWAEAAPALRTAIQAWLASAPCHPDTPPAWVAGPYPFPPFVWDEARRAILRAELDAYYAHLYGLTRKQLRYLLDPHDLTPGELRDILDPYEEVTDPLDEAAYRARTEKSAFPGETFRVLKEKELRQGAAYRTRRLVLEAWARLFVPA